MQARTSMPFATAVFALAAAACRDTPTEPAKPPVPTITAVSPLTQQATVNHFVASKPTVLVADAGGRPVAGANVVFSTEGANLPLVTTGPDGTASIDWKLSQRSGTQTILAQLASAKQVPLGPFVTFTALAVADTVAGIQAYSFPTQLGFPSSVVAIPPVIVAVDEYLNPKPGVEVSFDVTGGGSVTPAKITTDSTGRAIVGTWTLGGEFGTDTLVAHIPNFPPVYLLVGVTRPFVVSSIVLGYQHTCAISSGDVYCWGNNTAGQVKPTDPTRFWVLPQLVPLGVKVVSLSSGYNHTCAISKESPPQAYCWGDNSSGQLGVQTPGPGPVRVPVADGLASVTAGLDHSCGLTPAGVAYCWGSGTDGQLGNGEIFTCIVSSGSGATGCPGPRPVTGDLRFTSIAAGAEHTCGLVADGHMYCWGLDDAGQLGSSAGSPCTNYNDYYYYYYYGDYPVACALVPQVALGAPAFAAVAAGSGTCALTMDGAVACFGAGGGSFVPRTHPVTALSSDGDCGLGADGAALCWLPGFDAPAASFSQPASLEAGTVFTVITAAQHHRCGILKSNGGAVCWGSNDSGQLGNANTGGSLVPVPVALPLPPSNP